MSAHKHLTAFCTSQDISCVINLWNEIDEMTTVATSECVCVGVKPRANKEGGKSEKEKEKEKEIEERGALWMLHILCGIHIIIIWASTDSGIFTAK